MKGVRLLLVVLLFTWAGRAEAGRIFYRGGTWLETSTGVQRLSLLGVLRAWERTAEVAEGEAPSLRQREAVRLYDCLIRTSRSTDELLERITAFSFTDPDRVFYSLSDFVAEGLKGLCAER